MSLVQVIDYESENYQKSKLRKFFKLLDLMILNFLIKDFYISNSLQWTSIIKQFVFPYSNINIVYSKYERQISSSESEEGGGSSSSKSESMISEEKSERIRHEINNTNVISKQPFF